MAFTSSSPSIVSADKTRLERQSLAFSPGSDDDENNDASLIAASSRLILETRDGATLNIELFGATTTTTTTTSGNSSEGQPARSCILLVLHGICESAETKGIQAIVREGNEQTTFDGIIAVMELEGHGLSSGEKCLCPDFDRLVDHTVEAVEALTIKFQRSSDTALPLFLTGSSMGGALAIYVAEKISNQSSSSSTALLGVAPIAPAVGVDRKMLPPYPIVLGLTAMAYMAPALKLSLTPYEDPTQYNMPCSTKRNYKGHWPLATSKMLLDLTSQKAPGDVQAGRLSLSHVPNVLVVAGETDHAVPLSSIQSFHAALTSKRKQLMVVPKVGHELLFKTKSATKITKALFAWMEESLVLAGTNT